MSSIFKKYKNFTWYKKKACEVLIYDGEGSDILSHCVPKRAIVFILKIRTEMPLFLSAWFFFYLLIGIIKYKRPGLALTWGIIKYLKPKVIITYIDNSPTISWIKKVSLATPVIAIQNGMRMDFSIRNDCHVEYDHYFSFGSVEKVMFSQGGHKVTNFYPIGSLRAGIFRDEELIPMVKDSDLCYISQFNPIPLNTDTLDEWTREMYNAYYIMGKQYFYIICKYAENNNLRLSVAMFSPKDSLNFNEEFEYYSYPGKINIEHIARNRFSSYRAVVSSRLTFTISSTLGYEALGFGERVIFAKDVGLVNSLVMQGSWTDNLVTHGLPELQRLHNLDYAELAFKATEILKMKNEDYIEYTKNARSYYMNYDDEQRPHQIVKNKIKEFLKIKVSNGC